MPAGQVHLWDAAADAAHGSWSMNHAAFGLEPANVEPANAAAYDVLFPPPAAPALPDRRYIARRARYTDPTYRVNLALPAMHVMLAPGAVPLFQSPEFAAMTFDPCHIPVAQLLAVVAPVPANGNAVQVAAAAVPAVPAVAHSLAFG